MDFSKINILLDGHDLALPHGTGIRTYGLTLIAALRQLGAAPDLLAGAKWDPDPLVARALVHDVPLQPVRDYSAVGEWLRHTFHQPVMAEEVASQATAPLPGTGGVFPYGLGCAVSPYIYDHAHYAMEAFSFAKRFATRKKYDVWHSTLPLPLQPVGPRQITTIHDLIPLLQPHTCPASRPMASTLIRLAIKNSHALAVVSEHSRRDLLQHFDVPEEKVFVTYQPSPTEGWQGTERVRRAVMREYGLEPGKYLLFVGNIEPKKNVGRLLRAYLTLDCDLPLIIVGRKAWMWEKDLAPLQSGRLQERVRLLDYTAWEWVPYLYESAYCLLFPSLYEGFGLPPLEAMSVGCPVLCSNTSSLPEVMGDAAEYVDPLEVESIAQGMERMLNDRAHRDRLAAKSRERARLFSMENYLPRVRKVYEAALA